MPVPIFASLISLIPQAVSTISSIVKDKKERKESDTIRVEVKSEPLTGGDAIVDSLKEAVSGNISSKRILNVGGTAIIILHGISTNNVLIILVGAAYSLGMSFITYLSERKQ